MWTDKEESPSQECYSNGVNLAKSGAVIPVGYCAVFVVKGNLDEYHVILDGEHEYFCTCPSQRICKHVIAAREMQKTQVD